MVIYICASFCLGYDFAGLRGVGLRWPWREKTGLFGEWLIDQEGWCFGAEESSRTAGIEAGYAFEGGVAGEDLGRLVDIIFGCG